MTQPAERVIQKGTNNGVITDVDGNFTLTVPACRVHNYISA